MRGKSRSTDVKLNGKKITWNVLITPSFKFMKIFCRGSTTVCAKTKPKNALVISSQVLGHNGMFFYASICRGETGLSSFTMTEYADTFWYSICIKMHSCRYGAGEALAEFRDSLRGPRPLTCFIPSCYERVQVNRFNQGTIQVVHRK